MFTIGDVVEKALPPSERYKFDLVEILRQGGVAVVVGGRTTNFSDAMRKDPRLEFWDSIDPKCQSKDLPSNCRALLFTKFITHAWDGRLRAQAKRRGIYCKPGVYDTGALRVELQRVVDHAMPKPKVDTWDDMVKQVADAMTSKMPPSVGAEPPPGAVEAAGPPVAPKTTVEPEPVQIEEVVVAKPKRGPRGSITRFVVEHADLSGGAKEVEAKRIVALAKASGLTTTVQSVQEMMRLAARTARTAASAQSAVPAAPPVAVLAPAPPPVPVLAPAPPVSVMPPLAPLAAEVKQAQAKRSLPGGDALIQSISEAERYIGDMQAAASLLADLMPRLRTEIAAFREKQRRAAEIFLD